MRSLAVFLLAICSIFAATSCKDGDADKGEKPSESKAAKSSPSRAGGRVPRDLGWLKAHAPGGALAYSADKELYLIELADEKLVKIDVGFMPEFSPDGSMLAWINKAKQVAVRKRSSGEVRILLNSVDKVGGVHWMGNAELAAVQMNGKAKRWVRVGLDGKRSPIPELDQLGHGARETDVRQAADGVWSYVAYQSWKTSDGGEGPLDGGCACSISPDGLSTTALQGGHRSVKIQPLRKGGLTKEIDWTYKGGFDNHRWSSNDPDIFVCTEDKAKEMVVMNWKTGEAAAFGKEGHKDQSKMYGDFTRASGEGAKAWPPLLPEDQREGDIAVAAAENVGEVLDVWPYKTKDLVFLFENSEASNEFRVAPGAPPTRVAGLLRGRGRIDRFGGLDLREGSYQIDAEAARALREKVKAGGGFTVEFTARSASPEEKPLLTFGSNFKISFGAPDLYRHIVVIVTDGKITTYGDGEHTVDAVAAPLQDWKRESLVLGADWAGHIENIAIFGRAMDGDEVKHRAELLAPRLGARPPAPQVEVTARLTTYTPPLPLDALDTYRRCLSEHVFEVIDVTSGKLDAKTIRVLDWCIFDKQLVPQDLKEGVTYKLTLEPKAAHPQLARERVEGSDDFDSPEFLLIGKSKAE